jgi:hypothetical protein
MRIRPTARGARPDANGARTELHMQGDALRAERVRRLVIAVADYADAWREAANDAERAFQRWTHTPYAERPEAAAAYLAAIDREERAANDYSRVWRVCCMLAP